LELGWDEGWARELSAAPDPSLRPGRISRIDRGVCTVLTEDGALRVATNHELAAAVGDWVTIGRGRSAADVHQITGVLPRRCAFRRLSELAGATEQVVAANIDTVLLVDALDGHLSARHLERYLALAWQSGAVPAVVITKSDLAAHDQVLERVAVVEAAAPGVAVHVVSAANGEGMGQLAAYLAPGRTVALLGLSGAGKSTLVNLLAGAEVLATGSVRSDGKGRHTTTYRQLVPLSGGGLLIDTPGMRSLSVWGAADGVGRAFADIEQLAGRCQFPDCRHGGEAGCAVVAALACGQLTPDRLESWRRLRDAPGPVDHQAGRVRVAGRKRDKAVAKAARAQARRSAGSVD